MLDCVQQWCHVYFEENVANARVNTKQTADYLMSRETSNTTLVVSRSHPNIFEGLAWSQRKKRPDLNTLYLSPHVVQQSRKLLRAFAEVRQNRIDQMPINGNGLR